MTTDADRALARRMAQRICDYRRQRGAGTINHFSTNVPMEVSFYRGLLTEIAFAHEFDLPVNDTVFEYGDGGKDFLLPLLAHGITRVNVKSKTVTKSLEALVNSREGTHLRVPRHELDPGTIYIFGVYLVPSDTAEVHRWAWGHTLLDHSNLKTFINSNNDSSYTLRFQECTPLAELKAQVPTEFDLV
jgi:hypothetical protein